MLRDAALVLVLVAGCALVQPRPSPPPVEPGETPDLLCARACGTCPLDGPGPDLRLGTSDDLSCQRACLREYAGDPSLLATLRCEAAASTCAEQDACEETVP